jgi:hypothetical protein
MGDLRRKHPIIELIRTATPKSDEKHGGGKLTRLNFTSSHGKMSSQPFVLLLDGQVVLAYFR